MQTKPALTTLLLCTLLLSVFGGVLLAGEVSAMEFGPYEYETSASVVASPNPVALFQYADITMQVTPPAPIGPYNATNYLKNYSLVITKPDGTRETRTGLTADATGKSIVFYSPNQMGNYTLFFSFPRQNVTVPAATIPGYDMYTREDIMLPSNAITTLTVTSAGSSLPTPQPTGTPIPTPTSTSSNPSSQPTFTPQPTPTSTPKPISWCQVGVAYRASNNLTVKVDSLQVLEKDGNYKYVLKYTVKNDNWGQAISEGWFYVRSLDGSVNEEQHGMFVMMYPDDEFHKNYTWFGGTTQAYQVLEYHPSDFYGGSNSDYLSWLIQNSTEPESNLPKPTLQVACQSSTSYSNFRVEITGSLAYQGTGFAGVPVLLSVSVNGGLGWTDLTTVNTDGNGAFSAVWLPSVTGNNQLKATWAGNDTYAPAKAIVNFAVVSSEEKNVFSVSSNSTVTELAFNSTSNQLSFTVVGPDGTTGFVDLFIAKSLVGDANSLQVILDGGEVGYSAVSEGDSWAVHFQYHHSTHQVTINLNGSASSISVSGGVLEEVAIVGAAVAVTAVVVAFLSSKRLNSKQRTTS